MRHRQLVSYDDTLRGPYCCFHTRVSVHTLHDYSTRMCWCAEGGVSFFARHLCFLSLFHCARDDSSWWRHKSDDDVGRDCGVACVGASPAASAPRARPIDTPVSLDARGTLRRRCAPPRLLRRIAYHRRRSRSVYTSRSSLRAALVLLRLPRRHERAATRSWTRAQRRRGDVAPLQTREGRCSNVLFVSVFFTANSPSRPVIIVALSKQSDNVTTRSLVTRTKTNDTRRTLHVKSVQTRRA